MGLKEYLKTLKQKTQQENESSFNKSGGEIIHENENYLESKTDKELNEILENSVKTFSQKI